MLTNKSSNKIALKSKLTRSKLLVGFLGNYNSQNTRAAYRCDLEIFFKFLATVFNIDKDKNPINEINVEHAHLVVFKEYLKKNSHGHSTINRKLSTVTAYLNYLCDEGLRRDNPGLRVKRFKDITEGKTQTVTKKELNAVFKDLDLSTPTNIFQYAVVLTGFTTGIRVSGLCDLKLSDIVNEESGICVVFNNKGGKKEKAYLNSITSKAIFNYLRIRQTLNGPLSNDEYLFVSLNHNASKKLQRSSVNKMFKKFFADFSDREISPHSARAYYITEAIKLVGIREAQVRAKHKSVDTTALYDRNNYSGAIENIV